MYFSKEDVKRLWDGIAEIHGKSDDLLYTFAKRTYVSQKSNEFGLQGFMRRIHTLELCIENVYKSIPPEQTKPPSRNARRNAEINIQAFVINVFGCLDNLAWLLAIEKNFKGEKGKELRNSQIGLRKENELIREQISKQFLEYLIKLDDWIAQLENFRHALAHRIPLYIAPYTIRTQDEKNYHDLESRMAKALVAHNFEEYHKLETDFEKLKIFRPWMQHSFIEESKPIVFHAQIIADFNTVFEVAGEALQELDRT